MTEAPNGILKTPLGEFSFIWNSADHAYIAADEVIVNSVPYKVHFHIHLVEGEWKRKDWHEPYLNRTDDKRWSVDASPKARQKVYEVVCEAWTKFANENKILGLKAEAHRLTEEIEKCDTAIEELLYNLEMTKTGREALARALKVIELAIEPNEQLTA